MLRYKKSRKPGMEHLKKKAILKFYGLCPLRIKSIYFYLPRKVAT